MDIGMSSWNEKVDLISSDESSSSDSEMVITDSFSGKKSTGNAKDQLMEKMGQTAEDISSEGALGRRAEMYQDYMKRIPIPSLRGSVVPFTSWTSLGRSMKQLYGQPLHCLTNTQLKQWDRIRIGSEDEYQPLDEIIHPSKAEATVWLLEEIHRRTTSHHGLAKIWLSDPMHHAFVDSVFLDQAKS